MNSRFVETHPLISVHETAAVADAAQVMSDCSMGAVGVLGPDRELVGIFTERDLTGFVARHRDPYEVKLKEVVNDFPVVVEGPVFDHEAIERMTKAHIRHLLVREDGDVRVVSMRDLVLPSDPATPGDAGPGGPEEGAGWPYGITGANETLDG